MYIIMSLYHQVKPSQSVDGNALTVGKVYRFGVAQVDGNDRKYDIDHRYITIFGSAVLNDRKI
jgi:hypothetical protein